jgi:hypothetical protein
LPFVFQIERIYGTQLHFAEVVSIFSTRFERFLRAPLSILGQRRLLKQGVKNQKLFESRAKARSSSFDLALLQ